MKPRRPQQRQKLRPRPQTEIISRAAERKIRAAFEKLKTIQTDTGRIV